MTDLIIPLKIREDKSMLALFDMLQNQKQMRFSDLFKKIGIRNLYLLLSRVKEIESALQMDYAGIKLISVRKQKVGKKKFITFLEAYPEINIANISDSQALVKFVNVGENGAKQPN